MTDATLTSTYDLAVAAETAEEKAKLQKHFGRGDIFFFLVCTLFGIDDHGTRMTRLSRSRISLGT